MYVVGFQYLPTRREDCTTGTLLKKGTISPAVGGYKSAWHICCDVVKSHPLHFTRTSSKHLPADGNPCRIFFLNCQRVSVASDRTALAPSPSAGQFYTTCLSILLYNTPHTHSAAMVGLIYSRLLGDVLQNAPHISPPGGWRAHCKMPWWGNKFWWAYCTMLIVVCRVLSTTEPKKP